MALNEVVVYSDINKELPIAQTSTLNIKKIVDYFTESNQDEGFLPERKKEFQSFLISPDGNYFVIIIRQFLFQEAVQIIQYCAIVYCIEGKIIYRGKWQDYTFSYKCIIYKFSEDSQLFLCCGTEEILILKLKNLKEMHIKLSLSELEDVLFFNDQYIYYRQGWNHIIKYSIQKQEKELIFKHQFVIYSIYFDKDLVIYRQIYFKAFNRLVQKISLIHILQSLSLNESNTCLISDDNAKIILWIKGSDDKWQYKNSVIMKQSTARICFISEHEFIVQQWGQGYSNVFKIEDYQLKEQYNSKIHLSHKNMENDWALFPTIYNKRNDLIIQKSSSFVYIIRREINDKFEVQGQPIDCESSRNFGAMTNNGENLVIWNEATEEFRIYKLNYQ